MKVCVANAPWEQDGKWGIRSGCRFPNLMPKKHNSYVPFPFLLAYTAAYLESRGCEVLAIDGIAERCSHDAFLDRVSGFGPALLVAETATTSFQHDLALLDRLKQRTPEIRIALYGPHISAIPQDALNHHAIDFAINGEPELTSLELAETLSGKGDLSKVLGLVYRDSNGQTRMNPRRPQLADIETLPYPKRDGLPLHRYHVPGFPEQVMFIYASRGCPFQCTFCLWPQTVFERGTYRPRAAEKIVNEMVYLRKKYPSVRSFFFDDDTFNLGRARVMEFAAQMKRHNLKIPWGMNARADHWDREMLERLIETGLFTLRIGIESGDQAVLDRTKKGLNLEQARKTLELTHSLGIENHVSFMVGLAGETPESIENTIRYIKSIPVDSVQISVATPFPGTELHQFVQNKGFIVNNDWSQYSGSENAVMRTESMSADEIREAIVHLRRKVYFSPRFVRRRLSYVKNVSDLVALSKKVVRLALHRAAGPRARVGEI